MQQEYLGLTDEYEDIFVKTADAYEFSFVPQAVSLINSIDENGEPIIPPPANDIFRGIMAVEKFIALYPTYDFHADPSDVPDLVINDANLESWNIDLDWYLQRFYSKEEMLYILRTAQEKYDGFPSLDDLDVADFALQNGPNAGDKLDVAYYL